MATPANFLSQAATAIEAQVSGIVRLGSDYREDLESIPVGGTRYQLQGGPSSEDSGRSDGPRTVVTAELRLIHNLADPADERAYTEVAMLTNVEAMIAVSFWRNLAAVHEVLEPPSYDVVRVVNVITVTINVQVSIIA